jgi:hypothetical protein
MAQFKNRVNTWTDISLKIFTAGHGASCLLSQLFTWKVDAGVSTVWGQPGIQSETLYLITKGEKICKWPTDIWGKNCLISFLTC